MIELEHVTKFYRTVIGVNDLCLSIQEGAYGLIGPNGSGKTTLLHLLTGNLKPSLGKVRIAGLDPWRHRKVLSKIGLCPATDLLCGNVSAFQWVSYLIGLSGYSGGDARRMARESLVRVGMEEAMHREISGYSLGMRQRTKLAQAIACNPQWLILDEPFNGLDPMGRHDLASIVTEWGKSGRGLILASHVLHEVEAVTDRFLLIHGGRLLASGNVDEVQRMLVDFPQELVLKGRQLGKLATAIASFDWVTSLHFSQDRQVLRIGVREALAFYTFLASDGRSKEYEIIGMDSPQGNLENAFDIVLRAHRGELV